MNAIHLLISEITSLKLYFIDICSSGILIPPLRSPMAPSFDIPWNPMFLPEANRRRVHFLQVLLIIQLSIVSIVE